MKKINQQATKIFCRLLEKLGNHDSMKLISDGFMPLVLEQIGENISTPYGNAKLFSLAHYYEQNGDLMRDPEMVFIVVDNRIEKNDLELIGIYPQMYQQDSLGIYEESVNIEHNKLTTFKKLWQDSHCNFANMWLKNISQQSFSLSRYR